MSRLPPPYSSVDARLYRHWCAYCDFLYARVIEKVGFDFYHCPRSGSIVVRYGNEKNEEFSIPERLLLTLKYPLLKYPMLIRACKLALFDVIDGNDMTFDNEYAKAEQAADAAPSAQVQAEEEFDWYQYACGGGSDKHH